jgi:Flp pilus assembly protein TadD
MLTLPNVRTCLLVAAALLVFSVASGCSTSSRTSSLPQSHMLNGYEDFDTAGARAPSAKTLYRLAQLLVGQNQLPQAEAVLMNTIERYPKFSPAYSELASIQLRKNHLEHAIATLEAGIEAQPNDPVLHNNLGLCMMIKKEYELAYEACHTAWSLAPENARFAANAALALGMLGRTDESRAIYEQIMSTGHVHHNMDVIHKALDNNVQSAVESSATESLTQAGGSGN